VELEEETRAIVNGGSVRLEPKGNGCVIILEKLERFEAVALA
jgi:hypothetical protein